MSDIPPKAQLVPHQPFGFRERDGGRANYKISLTQYRQWESATDAIIDEGAVWVEWPLTVAALEDADEADPLNQLRTYTVRIGDALAYKAMFTDPVAESHMRPDFRRFIMALMVAIGVEHADEIKAAIAAEKEKAAAAA